MHRSTAVRPSEVSLVARQSRPAADAVATRNVKLRATPAKPVPQLPRIEPLGSPATSGYKILPHNYHEADVPVSRFRRHQTTTPKTESLPGKAAVLATQAVATVSEVVSRYIKPAPRPAPARSPITRGSRREAGVSLMSEQATTVARASKGFTQATVASDLQAKQRSATC